LAFIERRYLAIQGACARSWLWMLEGERGVVRCGTLRGFVIYGRGE
jgi:hypothetical protein